MNIFKALSEGNGRISETNITSFMSYLLDSTKELNDSFFVLFARLADLEITNNKICDLLNINHKKSIREQILYFKDNYMVSSEPEYQIQDEDGTKQIPDILLTISSKSTDEIITFLIIENKISKNAIKKGQLEKQVDYFKKNFEDSKNKPVYSVLITPDEDVFGELYNAAKEKHANTIWLKWINHKEREKSIEAKLRELIKYEHFAEIEPIDPNSQFIIKSFVDYIATIFTEKERGKMNFSYNGFDVVSEAKVIIENETYLIKRFSNNMIRLFDENENLLNVNVKSILREINNKYKLGIDLKHSNGEFKNTQVLGKEIIAKLFPPTK